MADIKDFRANFRIKKVFKLRDRLASSLQSLAGEPLTGLGVGLIIKSASEILKLSPQANNAVFQSLKTVVGTKLDKMSLRDLAWQLAANVSNLKDGQQLLRWSPATSLEEWAPVQIIDAVPIRKKKYESSTYENGFKYTFKILTGTRATALTYKSFSNRFIRAFSSRLGFTRPTKNFPFSGSGYEWVSLRLAVEFEPDKISPYPPFTKMVVTSSLLEWNRSIMKLRARDGFECPEGYTIPCHLCWHGYSSCPAACRPVDLVTKFCEGCQKEAWFDPRREELCLDCEKARKGRNHKRPTTPSPQ